MNVRQWINENSSLMSGLAVLLLVVALTIVWFSSGSGVSPMQGSVYYYDLDEGTVFSAQADELPPIPTPAGGNNGVRAAIYACGECPRRLTGMTREEVEEAGAFIAYFERYTDAAKQIIQRDRDRDPDAEMSDEELLRLDQAEEMGRVIRSPDRDNWVPLESDAGTQLTDDVLDERCPDQIARFCSP